MSASTFSAAVTQTAGRAVAAKSSRMDSIDILRGLDVCLMLFVNELQHGVVGAPAMFLHVPRTADGMTITDVVFPAFLFMVGLSIPFALAAREKAGDSGSAIWRHILTRAGALLVMGLLMVNGEELAYGNAWHAHLWNALMIVGVLLVWHAGSSAKWLRWLGIALLVGLVAVYRRDGVTGLFHIQPSWWGILGLIGWAYLVSAAIYRLSGGRLAVLVGGTALLYVLALADQTDSIPALVAVRPFVDVGRFLGAHSAIALSGVVLGAFLMQGRAANRRVSDLALVALGYALALGLAGVLLHGLRDLHPAFWINKIGATVPWCLISSAWTVAAWTVLFVLVDGRGWRRWPALVRVAGENALLVYVIPPLLLSLFALSAHLLGTDWYHDLASSSAATVARAILFAATVLLVVAWMRRRGLRLRV